MDTEAIQRQYYSQTAEDYDKLHVSERDEHSMALSFMVSMLDYVGVRSVLDLGSGTGRALAWLRQCRPGLRVVGVEPVKELREIGYRNGFSESELIDGDANQLPFADGEFDLCCEFAMLHHVPDPRRVVAEMLRVARRAVFVSDINVYGSGSARARRVKGALRALRLWEPASYLKTRGKGYLISEQDGLAFHYSVFDNYDQIARGCEAVHVLNTRGGGIHPLTSASHVCLLGIKKPTGDEPAIANG